MVSIVSFELEGDFAAFRDPTVTSNQTVYIIPSKSAVVGLIGAIIGLKRPNTLGPYYQELPYCKEYLDLMKDTMIGVQMRSEPKKVAFFTNHRSLKEKKTKPFKTELLIAPRYTIFVKSNDAIMAKIMDALESRSFVYPPMLGHAYCLARVPSFNHHEAKAVVPENKLVSTTILDGILETGNTNSGLEFDGPPGKSIRVIVERHLHHYFEKEKDQDLIKMPKRKVLRHWIPVPVNGEDSPIEITSFTDPLSIVDFYEIDGLCGKAICLY